MAELEVRVEGGAAVMDAKPALRISGVSKTFGPKTVLFPFELSLAKGEIHALVGQNGSGKSTLIKLLSGYHDADPGGLAEIDGEPLEFGSPKRAHELGLRVVHQDLGLIEESPILDNLAISSGFPTRFGTIRRSAARKRAVAALAQVGLDLDPEAKIATLSAAQRTGVAVARAMQADTGGGKVTVLILDEPTATLPAREVAHLHKMLKTAAAQGTAILYVTHHLDEVESLTHRVSVLRDGHLVLSADVADTPRAVLVHALVGSAVERVARERASDHHVVGREVALDVRGLEGDALAGVDFKVHAGEIVGLYGLTGSGRESLLGSIFGARDRDQGEVLLGGKSLRRLRPDLAIKSGLSYLAPDRKRGGGIMDLSAKENLTLPDVREFWRRGWFRRKEETRVAQEWMDKLQVAPSGAAEAPLASFSGGNQQKVLIGKWIRIRPKVMLLDEPTQGVDVGAKAELHRQILAASGAGSAVVVSSTDVEELASLCDRVLIIRSGVISSELLGDDVNETEINNRLHQSQTSKATEQ